MRLKQLAGFVDSNQQEAETVEIQLAVSAQGVLCWLAGERNRHAGGSGHDRGSASVACG